MTGTAPPEELRETLAVFDGVEPGTPLTTTEVADRLELGRRATYERLDRLAERGAVNTKKVGARGRVWWLAASPTARDESERTLEYQREQVAALNDLHGVVQDVIREVIDRSTRQQIEAVVCERLAASDSYLFAWIGEVDVPTQTMTLRTEAGVEGYLEDVTISVDPDDERSQGPTGQAVLRGETRVTQDIRADETYDPWRENVRKYGFRSSAAIPIVHEDTLYGVLNVYAERPHAFTDGEQGVIGRLGEVMGYAFAALDRKRALTSDEVVELEFRLQDVFDASADEGIAVDGTLSLDRIVPIGDGAFRGYGTATGDAASSLETLVESEVAPQVESVTIRGTDREETRFELELTGRSPPTVAASLGATVEEVSVEGRSFYMRTRLAPSADVGSVVGAIREVAPGIDLVTQRQVTVDRRSTAALRSVLFESLTDRQRAVLEVAYRAGYFASPRERTGEEIADGLEVSTSTVHQHLRAAERKLLEALFAEATARGEGA